MGVSKPTVHHWIVASTICVHCSSLKPILTEENKWARLEMALHFRNPEDPSEYQDMHDQIHLDEKWFFLVWEKERYLLFPKEKNPKWCVKHKLHITKVMFLCAVVRPQYKPQCKILVGWQIGNLAYWGLGTRGSIVVEEQNGD